MKHLKSAVLAAALAFTSPALAQDKTVEWRFAHWVPASHPMHPAAEAWAASIEKASGGTIKMKIYPAQQLGKAFDHYNMARDGIADVAHVNPGYEPGRFPVMGAMELPFLFSNSKEGSAALDACIASTRRRRWPTFTTASPSRTTPARSIPPRRRSSCRRT